MKYYNKIIKKINLSSLSNANKERLLKLNDLLYNYRNYRDIEFSILIIVKGLDNIDIKTIEKIISEMLLKYKVFNGRLWSINGYYKRIRLISRVTDKKAYKYELDKLVLMHDELKCCFDILEKVVDTNNSLMLIECLIDIDDEFYKHAIYNKCDFIFEGDVNVSAITNILLMRYETNGIKYDLNLKELEQIIEHNLNAKVFDTDELCMQYMYSKSLKSYIGNNRKKLVIEDIPVYEDIDEIIDKLDEEGRVVMEESCEVDPLYNEIAAFVSKGDKTSVSLIQRKFLLGYKRASKIVDLLEKKGIIGPQNDSEHRDVLVKSDEQCTGEM